MIALSWFALYCSSRSEFKVEQSIREELGQEVYCPTLTKWHRERRNAIRRIVRWPLMPGYVFPGLEPDENGDFPFAQIAAIDGVIRFVTAGSSPARLPYTSAIPPDARAWRTIGEIREMEQAGAFDFTAEAANARRAARKAKRIVRSFQDMAQAMAEAA